MRAYYPVSSQQSKIELREIQEHLLRLVGYDENVHDTTVEREGRLTSVETEMDASGIAMIETRIYSTNKTPLYSHLYRANFLNDLNRRKYV